jgi:6-pyruvoyltetrahydropterin/6-carboxytetrahydropterin synthase
VTHPRDAHNQPSAQATPTALRRTVRCTIVPDGLETQAVDGAGFSGSPSALALGTHYEIDATVAAVTHPVHAYVLDIKAIDRVVRERAVPVLTRSMRERPEDGPGVMREMFEACRVGLAGLRALRWRVSPFLSLEVLAVQPTTVLLRHRFDFAASHRLHAPELSAQENLRLYGKCNNPHGHGHNYQFEPCVALPARGDATALLRLIDASNRVLLDRFDHKHLNIDTTEFDAARGGVNPSVENIAMVFFGMLAPVIAREIPGGTLRDITVWETDRTCATFPALPA